MSFLFRRPDPLDLNPEQALTDGLGTFQENIRSAFEFARTNEQSYSEATVLHDQWQPLIEEINERTDAGFYNPANHLNSGLFTTASEGHGIRQYEHYTKKIFKYIQENKDVLGEDLAGITHEQLLQQGMDQAKYNREVFEEVAARSPGGTNMIARITGSIGGLATDPLLFQTMFIGGGATSFRAAIFREAMIGAGTEASAQAGVKDWYESLGYDYTYEDFYQAVALGGLFGGATPLAFRVAGKTYSLTTEQAKKGYDAIINSGAFKKTPMTEAMEDVARAIDEDMAANPLSDPKNEVSASAHQRYMEQATVAVENMEPPPIPDKPEINPAPRATVYEADNLDGIVYRFNPDEIQVDAKTFQFKEGGDEFGVTERLQGVTKWMPEKSGQVTVYEYADGRKFIADGHQRLGLAKRIKALDPSQDVRLYGQLLREVDGVTPAMARVSAALKNISEGTGTAIDATKVMREAPERVGELPPQSDLVKQSRDLMLLGDDAFGAIINGVIPANYGALVGKIIEDEALQKTAIGILAKADPSNVFQAEAIIRQIKVADFEIREQESLFGDELIADSFYLERAKVLDKAVKLLRQDKNAFASLNRNAERLEQEGNQLAREANQRRADHDTQSITLLQTAANTPGQISDALTAAAKQARETGSYTNPVRGFVDTVRQSAESGYFDGLSAGDVGRSFNAPTKSRAFEDEATKSVDEFDDPRGPAFREQADQLEQDMFGDAPDPDIQTLNRLLEKEVTLRNDPDATPEQLAEKRREINENPAVTRALDEMSAIPETHAAADYGSETWGRDREFKFGQETVVGYEAGIARLEDNARRLAWIDDGLEYPGADVIAARYADEAKAPGGRKKKAVIVVGPPASGKSSIANPIARELNASIIDSDEVKKVLPEYQGGIGANAVHVESGAINQIVMENVMDAGDNIVIPTVGNDVTKVRRFIQDIRDAGYDEVYLVDMKVPIEDAKTRMLKRFIDTGRIIPVDYLDSVSDLPTRNYDILREEGIADGYARIDNSVPKDADKPVLEDTTDFLERTDIRLRYGRPGDRTVDEAARVSDVEEVLKETDIELDLEIPVELRVDEETGELVASTVTARQIQEEIAQDQAMLDRLRGCVE